jgi:predicted dehydrogenase
MIRFGIIGTGWRSEFYLRAAAACPDQLQCVGLVSRNPDREEHPGAVYRIPLFGSAKEMVSAGNPLFTVTSVTRAANPGAIDQLVAINQPVLSETPPADTVKELEDIYKLVQKGAKIQVAEQYHLQPHHFARIAYAQSGKLGKITQAQVSVAHGYHGISLIRRLLGIGFENAVVTGKTFTSPIVKTAARSGPEDEEAVVETTQKFAMFDFGDQLGVFDFLGDQYRSHIRGQRLMVRGSHGEILQDVVTYLQDHVTPILLQFRRQEAGPCGNLEGNFLKGYTIGEEWIYRNPLAPGALADDDIAVGHCLLKMAKYIEGGPEFYSLAEACQDRYLDIVMEQAQESAEPVQTTTQVWAQS